MILHGCVYDRPARVSPETHRPSWAGAANVRWTPAGRDSRERPAPKPLTTRIVMEEIAHTGAIASGIIGGGQVPASMVERLELRRAALAAQLEQVDTALAAMKDNPEVARVVDAISKLGHF